MLGNDSGLLRLHASLNLASNVCVVAPTSRFLDLVARQAVQTSQLSLVCRIGVVRRAATVEGRVDETLPFLDSLLLVLLAVFNVLVSTLLDLCLLYTSPSPRD